MARHFDSPETEVCALLEYDVRGTSLHKRQIECFWGLPPRRFTVPLLSFQETRSLDFLARVIQTRAKPSPRQQIELSARTAG
ncbi:hypothetical protein C492_10140 [Natronococcus jeotgali DSM 18795]|uniref:Uncharacterized protein n=1 Tax=Natronococcus jeotgali DSM 18795 TaxID=1227498 RepID=L9XGV9_9EURY|nr:hypothetical protein C492_10140 [Natronococcus jeotgali DSM 18795]